MREMELLRNPKGELGRWLAAELRARRVSVREASREMEVSHSQVKNWLGGTQPEPASTGKLAAWGGVSIRQVQRMAGYPLDLEDGGEREGAASELRTLAVPPEDVSLIRRILATPRRSLSLALDAIEAATAEGVAHYRASAEERGAPDPGS